jgi:hypothetical protein
VNRDKGYVVLHLLHPYRSTIHWKFVGCGFGNDSLWINDADGGKMLHSAVGFPPYFVMSVAHNF